ncbi:SPOR domain-containing protein [Marinobacterium stanieri]|uniref:SPOR domain-containing protein n=1 Tax=Marinobacterium stanieri TaxID=49186 RepID=UPI00025592B5|nr:SPOR domain-containing protein [Marinobacterium stanieri]
MLSSLVITPAAVSALSSDSSVSAQAQSDFQKGEALMNGIGVEQNLGKAKQLLQKAAEQGHTEAQVLLGRLHYYMPGEVDLEKTRYWWLEAARQGHPRAQYQLAILYLKRGDADPLEAMAWMHMAKASGEPRAEQVWPKMQEQFEVDSEKLVARVNELQSETGLGTAGTPVLLAGLGPVLEAAPSSVQSEEPTDSDIAFEQQETDSHAEDQTVAETAAAADASGNQTARTVMKEPAPAVEDEIEEQAEAEAQLEPELAKGEPSTPSTAVVEPPVESADEPVFPEGFYVQLASVKDAEGAESLAAKVAQKQSSVLGNWEPRVKYLAEQGSYKIWVGAFSVRGDASVLCESLQAHKQDCFVVKR